jgi:hypothetical protein
MPILTSLPSAFVSASRFSSPFVGRCGFHPETFQASGGVINESYWLSVIWEASDDGLGFACGAQRKHRKDELPTVFRLCLGSVLRPHGGFLAESGPSLVLRIPVRGILVREIWQNDRLSRERQDYLAGKTPIEDRYFGRNLTNVKSVFLQGLTTQRFASRRGRTVHVATG